MSIGFFVLRLRRRRGNWLWASSSLKGNAIAQQIAAWPLMSGSWGLWSFGFMPKFR
jgi:hypothetical protein